MKLISAAVVLLCSASANAASGANIRGGAKEKDQDRKLQANVGEGDGPPGLFGAPSGQPGQAQDYDCEEGCEVGPGAPVCGVDGLTYFNECFALCQDVEIERNGACPDEPPMNIASYSTEGRVTKQEMGRFKAEKFKLVAKRNPQAGELPDREPQANGAGGPGNDNGNGPSENPGQSRRSTKAVRVTDTGLEYVAEYEMDEIPEGLDYEPSEGEMPETAEDVPDPDAPNRLLSVLGTDTRVQQSGWNWPNWRLTHLDYWSGWWIFGSWSGRCSGAIIGTNKVLTAAHCVYDTGSRSWMVPGRVAPGRTGSSDPWGRWDVDYATTYSAWVNGAGWEYDIAVLTIKGSGSAFNTNIGTYMGYLGMAQQPCSPFAESQYRITGYPGDKPDGTIWNTGQCDDWWYSCGSRKLYHQCDTYGGMSGSAMRDGYNRIIGVHAYGAGSGSWNSGTAMNSQHLANVQYW